MAADTLTARTPQAKLLVTLTAQLAQLARGRGAAPAAGDHSMVVNTALTNVVIDGNVDDPALVRRFVNPFGIGVDSYTRVDALITNLWRGMPRADWFAQLGEAWSCCDNISRWRPEFRNMLLSASREELDLMMDEEERAALALLPERIPVWRGCYAVNKAGLSWSTSRDVAARFPGLMRYWRPGNQPILRHGWTRRERAALKLDRGEHEIIAARVFGIEEEHIAARGENDGR